MIGHDKDVFAKILKSDAVKNASMKVLVGPEQGWQSHVMRVVELAKDGFSPCHAHPWPHINYMLEGEGILILNGEAHAVTAGSFAYVPSNTEHQFKNSGDQPFRFICIVPKEGHK